VDVKYEILRYTSNHWDHWNCKYGTKYS